jgi:hypothetical protein
MTISSPQKTVIFARLGKSALLAKRAKAAEGSEDDKNLPPPARERARERERERERERAGWEGNFHFRRGLADRAIVPGG